MASPFAVKIFGPGEDAISLPPGLSLIVTRYDSEEPGGPVSAEIVANGPHDALQDMIGWIGHRVEIYNEHGAPVWWGELVEAVHRYGVFEVGFTLDGLANRIKIEYTTELVGGLLEARQTAWAENTRSIARYGAREFVERNSNLSDAAALERQARLLSMLSRPQPVLRVAGQGYGGVLRCRGQFRSYGWTHYSNPNGLVLYEGSDAVEQPLGLGFSGNDIGFDNEADTILTMGGQAMALADGYKVRITGSASNDGTYTVLGAENDPPIEIVSNAISFEASALVRSTGSELSFIRGDDLILISGSSESANNRYAFVDAVSEWGSGGTEVDLQIGGSPVVTSAAGPSVTVKRANAAALDGSMTRELPGASVTVLAHGQRIAQSFQIPGGDAWTAASIAIKIARVGNPTGNVTVSLHSNSAGAPGTQLDSASIAASNIPDASNWIRFDLSNTVTLNPGTTYWINIAWSAGPGWANYFTVEVAESADYADGSLLLYDGAAWQTRDPAADLVFRVLGAEETTTQIQDILSAGGWQIAGVRVHDASGIETNQYRDGNTTRLAELLALLELGADDGSELQLLITPDRVVHVRKRPMSNPGDELIYTVDGRWRMPGGGEAERGVLPVGQWITLGNGPQIADALISLMTIYCRRAEYDATTDTLTPDPALDSVWNIGGISE